MAIDLETWKRTLEQAGVRFDAGLLDSELEAAQRAHHFRFPPDLEELLRFALPMGRGWPNWREPLDPGIAEAFAWPLEGILFDIENNDFWLEEWGLRPPSLDDAFAIARERVAAAPRLIPISGHRYLPETPRTAGNPVFSVYQTDIIHYGRDLEEYFANEFPQYFRGPGGEFGISVPVRRIEFWSRLVEID